MKRTPDARKRRSKAVRELIFVIGLASIVFVLSTAYDFFDRFVVWRAGSKRLSR